MIIEIRGTVFDVSNLPAPFAIAEADADVLDDPVAGRIAAELLL